jgi:hypothetical protein
MKNIFHIILVGMFINYIHKQFHLPSSTVSLVIEIKRKVKYLFGTVAIYLLYIL